MDSRSQISLGRALYMPDKLNLYLGAGEKKGYTLSFSDSCSRADSISSIEGRELFISVGIRFVSSY